MHENIVINNLYAGYGRKKVLHGIDLNINKGMFGLLGRNGAGKSTLMKTLVGLLEKKSGEISVCGIDISNRKQIREIIGYLPQDFNMYPNMKVDEALKYLGTLSGMKSKLLNKRVEDVLDLINLQNDRKKKVKSLSGGMKRRLGIGQAIIHNPKVLIVDEPTAGLDPEERIRFRNILADLAEDKVVILSTHIAGDIESTSKNLAIMNEGKIVFNGKVDDLKGMARGFVYKTNIAFEDIKDFKNRYIITSQRDNGEFVEMKFLYKGSPVSSFTPVEPSIEDGYLNVLYDVSGVK
ncbi:ABC transporter ATP-binding protein [Miniphocaeibacter halophilus]|uniref:ABC transporter ATP-binding protein n=1 Tax=Miniphocaeibacter halophilus TaxID=2931922 RepID=A0AC61N1M6_9FIRM|nr:ABC transporter ATP-binding protein [Miniphocaeibacter halophilus]QQK08711.1 ABC transporter ATP-binding protein [Miniphocaeibacter halophilus]